MAYTIKDIDERILCLQEKKEELSSGAEFCDHHWNGSDSCYECYCTECGKHIAEVTDRFSVPFKHRAYCGSCSETVADRASTRPEKSKAQQHCQKTLAGLSSEHTSRERNEGFNRKHAGCCGW